MGPVVLLVVVVVAGAACAAKRAAPTKPSASTTAAQAGSVVATTPPLPPGVKICDTVRTFAGWPTTAAPRPDAYRCILDALAAGTPAQMSTISGIGNGGRKTQDGDDVLKKEIVTLRVLGTRRVQVTTDLTEAGGAVTTKTCAGVEPDALGYHGIDCS